MTTDQFWQEGPRPVTAEQFLKNGTVSQTWPNYLNLFEFFSRIYQMFVEAETQTCTLV